jgi:hypothetical protein
MSEDFDEEYEIPINKQGFDRGIDYGDTKKKLIEKFMELEEEYHDIIENLG